MKKDKLYFLVILVLIITVSCNQQIKNTQKSYLDKRVDSVLKLMTLEEKIGQLNQLSNPYMSTGTGEAIEHNENYDDLIRKAKVGSFLNVTGAEETYRLQKLAVEESRLGIPLLFAYDVIHGYKTMFPIPLAEAASFDRKVMQKSARIAAIESSANGLNWTFAPMIDVSRDPRWGRIMEGAGEDVYLNEQAAIARIKGFQGKNLADANTIAACAKHFVGYGAALAGRDYHSVDMSERMLREVYLPPFKAAVNEEVATIMTAFNTVNGVPASGNKWIQTNILREEWNYKGFVISDWDSMGEMEDHGNVEDDYSIAKLGVETGVDVDMQSLIYIEHIEQLIKDGQITEQQINKMVRRILRVKFRLGLFDNPYQYCDKEAEKNNVYTDEHLAASRNIAKRSIVLLKNEENILPLSKDIKTIAVIGPLAKDKDAPIGNWRAKGEANSAVSLFEGIENAVSENTNVIYAEGCKLVLNEELGFFMPLEINETDRSGFAEAVRTAKKADVVVMALGEIAFMSGECRSYADISLQGLQLDLLQEIRKTGKPIVLTLFNGRPMVLTDVVEYTDAILECWLLGSQSGNAIADVLFGDYNPSGKLPSTFPYHVGQIPIYYELLNGGRPLKPNVYEFSSKYRDIPNTPLFAFGYGLSYTTFEYSGLKLSSDKITFSDSLIISAKIKNTGDYDGEEVVQLYIRDVIGNGVSRPVLQLKGFEKIMIRKGEIKDVQFIIKPDDLAFFRLDKKFAPEAGMFKVFLGTSSDNLLLESEFELVEN